MRAIIWGIILHLLFVQAWVACNDEDWTEEDFFCA